MKYSKKNTILVVLLPVQYIFIKFLSTKPEIIEHYYSNIFFPYIAKTLRILLGWIPFSVGDFLGFILLFLFVKSLYKLIATKFTNFIAKLLKFIGYLSILYFLFYAFWGLNYFREPLAKKLNLSQSSYTTEQLYETTKQIASLLNTSHYNITKNDSVQVILPYSSNNIHKLAPNGFIELSKSYPELAYKFPSIKNSMISLIQSYMGTSGYINPITGEAQINYKIPKTRYPSTICHEMAHQIGWAAENDANFIGFLASISNKDNYFKYAGYQMAFVYCIGELQKRDKSLASSVKKKINSGIYKDYKSNYLFWKQYETSIKPYFRKGYHSYLKANNQVNGINSYNYIVDLLIAYFNK